MRREPPPPRALIVGVLAALLVLVLLLAWALGAGLVTLAKSMSEDQAVAPGRVHTVAESVSQASPPTPVRVATFNTNRFHSVASVHRDVRRLAPHADVLMLQETPRGRVRMAGWTTTPWPSYSGNRPILWRPARFNLVAWGTALAHVAVIHRRTTWVVLADRQTGQRWRFVNVHGLPHVERRGHPRFGTHQGRCPCVRAYVWGMHRLGRLVRAATTSRLVVAGDWNVGRVADQRVRWPYFPTSWSARVHLIDTTARACCAGPTLAGRAVDRVLVRPTMRVRSTRVLHGYSSDHRPVVVTFPAR